MRPLTPALLTLLLLPQACRSLPKTTPPTKPNILILYTDDQGYGDCGAFNPDCGFDTPNIDRIAREGIAFTDGHSAGSVCTPSRYALLTGRYAWRTGRVGVLGADSDCMIEDGRTTIASMLADHGYHTGAIGKWHVGMQIPGTKGERDWSLPVTNGPLTTGFDEFHGIPASMNFGVLTWFDGAYATEPASMWTRKKFPDAEITTKPLDYSMSPPYDAEQRTDGDIEVAPSFRDVDALSIITTKSVAFIERNAHRPFLLYVPFTSPHLPHCTAPEFRGTSGMGNYGDFLVETDHRVGEILDALDRAGIAENTLVVFTSDNGPENNWKDWERIYGHRAAGGFRGGKRDVYEGGHRVPFLVRWPHVVEPGRASAHTVGQVDLLATIADVVHAELPEGASEDGVSFLPALLGEEPALRPPLVHQGRGRFAVRDGDWKLICAPHPERSLSVGEPAELYDLSRDPGEERDVLANHPKIAARLHALAELLVGEL